MISFLRSETSIKKSILNFLKKYINGMFWSNPTGTRILSTAYSQRPISFGKKGSSDIIGCLKGRFIAIEVKSAVGTMRKSQKEFKRDFEQAGGLFILLKGDEWKKTLIKCLEDNFPDEQKDIYITKDGNGNPCML